MSELSHEVELVLQGKMNDENIRVLAEMVDFLKYKEDQSVWAAIDASEPEETTEEEREEIRRIMAEERFNTLDMVIGFLNDAEDGHV